MTAPQAQPGSSAEAAYQQLREEIVAGTRMPNEHLVEADLVTHLAIGRTVIRTILTRLEQEGLVVREPNRGARVRMVSEAEAVEILQARSVLEALAAQQAAARVTPEEIQDLRTILAEASTLLENGNLLSYSDCNARLHDRVVEISRNTTAQRLIDGLKAQLVRFQYKTVLVPGRSVQAFAEHSALVDAIADHDPARAERAMSAHLGHIADALGQTALARGDF